MVRSVMPVTDGAVSPGYGRTMRSVGGAIGVPRLL